MLLAEAARLGGVEAMARYREALELVRGEPFADVARGRMWGPVK